MNYKKLRKLIKIILGIVIITIMIFKNNNIFINKIYYKLQDNLTIIIYN